MDKEQELRKNKNKALSLLCAAALIFLITAFLPRDFWIEGIKTVSEAAMVGALADWFAVVALFKRVPIPIVSRHTEIIPKNKERIADNLADFVRERFLDVPSIVLLIRKHNPAEKISQWLSTPANAQLLGGYVAKILSGALELTDDKRIQTLIKDALHAGLDKVDLSRSTAAIFDTLTKDNRHQELLDEAIAHLIVLLRQPATRAFVARRIVDWLKSDHPKMQVILPTEWLGENGAELMAAALNRVLIQVGDDPNHELRKGFDGVVERLILKLKTDPTLIQKGEELKRQLRDGETLNLYIKNLWGQLRDWLKNDLARDDSVSRAKVATMGSWVGRELTESKQLRESLNEHLEDAARSMAPDFSDFLTRHISDTVRNWDSKEMSKLIELNIGKDLQYIRINGTVVGGLIGMLLYAGSYGIDLLRLQMHMT